MEGLTAIGLVEVDLEVVFSSPGDGGRGRAGSAAFQSDVGALLHHHVPGGLPVHDVGRHWKEEHTGVRRGVEEQKYIIFGSTARKDSMRIK